MLWVKHARGHNNTSLVWQMITFGPSVQPGATCANKTDQHAVSINVEPADDQVHSCVSRDAASAWHFEGMQFELIPSAAHSGFITNINRNLSLGGQEWSNTSTRTYDGKNRALVLVSEGSCPRRGSSRDKQFSRDLHRYPCAETASSPALFTPENTLISTGS